VDRQGSSEDIKSAPGAFAPVSAGAAVGAVIAVAAEAARFVLLVLAIEKVDPGSAVTTIAAASTIAPRAAVSAVDRSIPRAVVDEQVGGDYEDGTTLTGATAAPVATRGALASEPARPWINPDVTRCSRTAVAGVAARAARSALSPLGNV
jgi:hypothetical protein